MTDDRMSNDRMSNEAYLTEETGIAIITPVGTIHGHQIETISVTEHADNDEVALVENDQGVGAIADSHGLVYKLSEDDIKGS